MSLSIYSGKILSYKRQYVFNLDAKEEKNYNFRNVKEVLTPSIN